MSGSGQPDEVDRSVQTNSNRGSELQPEVRNTDALDEILATVDDATLRDRYDSWAADYDHEHADWGWRGANLVADTLVSLFELDRASVAGGGDAGLLIVDAGCGTGNAGRALRERVAAASVVGLDFSRGMLTVAAESIGAYDALVQASLYQIPLRDGAVGGVMSSGVFTHGHVGPDAFSELCRVIKPGGYVVVTQRLDIADRFAAAERLLAEQGRWAVAYQSDPLELHPDRDSVLQTIKAWRVLV